MQREREREREKERERDVCVCRKKMKEMKDERINIDLNFNKGYLKYGLMFFNFFLLSPPLIKIRSAPAKARAIVQPSTP